MRRIGDLTAGPLACLLLLGAGGAAPALAQEMPLSVIYGPAASTAEGDDDYRELIFLSVPADLEDRLYLRIFDPDTGGDHDLAYGGSEDTETRYALVGGAGALSAVAGSAAPSAEDLASGEPIREASVAASAALDGKWQTIASFLPDQGELVGERRVFRLLVEGLAGNDANLYAATLSLRDRRNLAPGRARGLRLLADRAHAGRRQHHRAALRGAAGRRSARPAQFRCRQRRGHADHSTPLGAARRVGSERMARERGRDARARAGPARGDHVCGRRGDPERCDLPDHRCRRRAGCDRAAGAGLAAERTPGAGRGRRAARQLLLGRARCLGLERCR